MNGGFLKWVAAVAALMLAGQVSAQVAKTQRVDPGTHLGVRANQLVQVYHEFDQNGWKIIASDGSVRSFSVPAGQVLIITDFLSESYTTAADAAIFLQIEQPGVEGSTRLVYSYRSTNGGFADAIHDHMTTGFVVPAGWVLKTPVGIFFSSSIFVRLYGYFAAAS